MSDSPQLDDEWMEALEVEPEAPDAGPADADDSDGGTGGDEKNADGDSSDATPGSSDGEDAKGEPAKADDDAEKPNTDESPKKDESETGADEPSESFAAKEDIKRALRELGQEQAAKTQEYDGLKKEVMESLYPEGIDRTLRDADGDPINGIEDLTKLINPKTNDLFTEEEAGQYLLTAKQKLNEDAAQVEQFVESVAETNMNLIDGAKRVAEVYGDFLAKEENKDLAQRVLQAYDKTIIKDPKTGVALRAPVDVEEFYEIALKPYVEAAGAAAANQIAGAKADQAKADKAAKNAQRERGDLSPKGQSEPPVSDNDKEWAKAIKDYEEGR